MTKPTGRRRGRPFIVEGERSVVFRIRLPRSMVARIDVRARELGMGRSTWLRLVADNALAKVPRQRSEESAWFARQLVSEAPPLIREVNRAARNQRPGPPRVLP